VTGFELARHRLSRAWETLEEAKLIAASGHWNGAVNRLYYACFYAVNALLLSQNLSSPKHTGVRSLFSIHFVRKGTFPKELAVLYNTLFDARQESDYEDFFRVHPEEVQQWIPQAERFIQYSASLLGEKSEK
jgi:uncharacterized protein